METKGTNDASFRITLNKVKIDKFNSENLKIYAEEIVDINIRIVGQARQSVQVATLRIVRCTAKVGKVLVALFVGSSI